MNRSPAFVSILVAVLVAVGLGLSIKYWPWLMGHESPGAAIRNIALVLAGLIAIPLTLWRVVVAERQADVAQQGLLQDRYQKGAEMLGNTLLSVRLGGIYALVSLAQQHPDLYRSQIMRLLCAFVRHPAADENAQDAATPGRKYPRLREDVQAAVTAVTARGDNGPRESSTERIDFRGAYLQGAGLGSANLSGADLENTDMTGATLSGADLHGARVTSARLHRAHMLGTDLTGAHFGGADLSHVVAQRASFSGANLSSANLSHADLQRADLSRAHIGIADLTGASLLDANLSGASFGKGTRRVTASDPPVSEIVIARVTQAQLDEARAEPDNPPKVDPAVVDAETGAPLVWRGKVLSELPGGCGP